MLGKKREPVGAELDLEWAHLILLAKSLGISLAECRDFFVANSKTVNPHPSATAPRLLQTVHYPKSEA